MNVFSSIDYKKSFYPAAVSIPSSPWLHVLMVYKHVMHDSNSRRIFMFLCLNFAFMFIEVAYGLWTNSLGLISDAGHMMFDCAALCIGLYASYVSKLQSTRVYTYGFGRYEELSGFVNGMFLVFIAYFVFMESFDRLFDPDVKIDSERLLTVSILGLLVNLVGICFFHQEHHHLGDDGHKCSSHNHNMEGIFLHVLADALGSVGVIISSACVHYLGWVWTDAFCSMLISCLILLSVYPLIMHSAHILLQCTPKEQQHVLKHCLDDVVRLKCVLGYRQCHFWVHSASSGIIGTLHIHTEQHVDESTLVDQIVNIFARGNLISAHNLTIQIEKEQFLHQHDSTHCLEYSNFEYYSGIQYQSSESTHHNHSHHSHHCHSRHCDSG